MEKQAVVVLFALTGCASTVDATRSDGAAVDAAVVRATDGGACAALTCWNLERGTFALPAREACATDADCVVRRFQSDRGGTIEIVGVPAASVAAFDRAAMTCSNSGDLPPGQPFYEGGAFATRRDAASVALCRGGCCVAVAQP